MMVLRLAVLGDSIAYGVGAARHADTLAPRLAADLASQGVPVETSVVAVPGARSEHLGAQVTRVSAWRPHVAVIVIGANDLTRFVRPDEAAAHLHDAVSRLDAIGAEVVVAPAPDLSIVPHVPAAMRPIVRAGSALLRREQMRVTLGAGGRVADVEASTSATFARDPALFSADRFHPSSAGYAVVARALAPAVSAAAVACAASDR